MSKSPKVVAQERRKLRIRSKINGNADRPRLSVSISLQNVSAQIIDDTNGKTLASARSAKAKASIDAQAAQVGTMIAEAAKKQKITKVVFDRNGRQYHKRMKSLADAARKAGLEF